MSLNGFVWPGGCGPDDAQRASASSMSTVHSTRWHRVADLLPRLSAELRLRRQRLRGETWHLLANPASGRSVRLNQSAYAIAARMDGSRSVQQLWDQSLQRDADTMTQDEMIDLLAQLRESALVLFDRAADFDALLPHLDKVAKPGGGNSLLAIRLPLGNPTRLLNRLAPLQDLLFSRAAAWLWLLAVATLVLLVVQNVPGLWAHGQRWMATPRFILLAGLLYLPIKLLHELAHGLAVRRWGGQVREAGVTLMLLMPVPYVDASAATSFARRRTRVVVSAAGIMTELALAAIALPLWLWLDDGLLRDCAFVTLVVAGVSTLLFNGNPLQRLDGYYILTDLLDLPNLGPRSRAWWLDLLRRRLLGLAHAEPMPVARGETPWLVLYAPLSWLMVMLIASLAVAWLGRISLTLGLIAATVLVWQVGLLPMRRLLGQLRRVAQGQDSTTRRWRLVAWTGATALALVLFVPLPRSTLVQGVVWPPDQAQLRIEEAGFVQAVLATDGAMLRSGDLVLELASPQLLSDQTRQMARVHALQAELVGAWPQDKAGRADARAGDAQAELAAAQAELERLENRLAALVVRAGADGRLVLPDAADLANRFLRRGHLLGQVLSDTPPIVRVAVPESQMGDLHPALARISVSLSATPNQHHGADALRNSSGAVMQLPSAALSARHGGDIVTDPADAEDLRPLEPVVVLDVLLRASPGQAPGAAGERIGERAWVRFATGSRPLALEMARALRQQVLRRFNPQL